MMQQLLQQVIQQSPFLAVGYVDPGSGHLMLQLGLAFAAGVLFYVRAIIDWFRPSKKNRTTESTLAPTLPAEPEHAPKSMTKTTKRKVTKKKTVARRRAS